MEVVKQIQITNKNGEPETITVKMVAGLLDIENKCEATKQLLCVAFYDIKNADVKLPANYYPYLCPLYHEEKQLLDEIVKHFSEYDDLIYMSWYNSNGVIIESSLLCADRLFGKPEESNSPFGMQRFDISLYPTIAKMYHVDVDTVAYLQTLNREDYLDWHRIRKPMMKEKFFNITNNMIS